MSNKSQWIASLACLVLTPQLAGAAVLDGSAAIVPPGEDYLSIATLGTPSTVWAITMLEWDQTAEVTIEAGVASPDGDPGIPITHIVFAFLNNNTADHWKGFELSVAGPASFANPLFISPAINRPEFLGLPGITSDSISFDGLDWVPNDFQTTLSFGLDITPPISNEPVLLSFRPIPAPEPGCGMLLVIGWLLGTRRRNRH